MIDIKSRLSKYSQSRLKEGDFVMYNDRRTGQIEPGIVHSRWKDGLMSVYRPDGTYAGHFYNKDITKWTIDNIKEGDVLSHTGGFSTCIVKKLSYPELHLHCILFHNQDEIVINPSYPYSTYNLRPATSSERDKLRDKLEKEKYRWDETGKELVSTLGELEITLYSWLSSDTKGELSSDVMRRCAISRAQEIRNLLKV